MWTEERLDSMHANPSTRLVEDIKKIEGDIVVLGAGGKMGPTLCYLAKNACMAAGIRKRIIAVSRYQDPVARSLIEKSGVETISCDMLLENALDNLPDAPNIIHMAGRKFGTKNEEYLTWAMNARLASAVSERYKHSRIVVFSSGNIYPFVKINQGGCTEDTPVFPVGEYAMSCLARERMFEYASRTHGTPILMYRLNYAIDLRYGVLHDLAEKILKNESIPLDTPVFNCIWQKDANEIAIRALLHCKSPQEIVNVTGPETVSVRCAATELARLLSKNANFCGSEQENALLSNSDKCVSLFGYPTVGIKDMIRMQAEWLLEGGRTLGKPTHFEERRGDF